MTDSPSLGQYQHTHAHTLALAVHVGPFLIVCLFLCCASSSSSFFCFFLCSWGFHFLASTIFLVAVLALILKKGPFFSSQADTLTHTPHHSAAAALARGLTFGLLAVSLDVCCFVCLFVCSSDSRVVLDVVGVFRDRHVVAHEPSGRVCCGHECDCFRRVPHGPPVRRAVRRGQRGRPLHRTAVGRSARVLDLPRHAQLQSTKQRGKHCIKSRGTQTQCGASISAFNLKLLVCSLF